jgi:peptidoglycan/xylan/chitin deacetylase (PgdA/CDA1 family)
VSHPFRTSLQPFENASFNMGKRVKYFIRVFFGGVFFYAGIFCLVRFFNNVWGRRLTIVTYHRITDRKISEIEASLPFLFTSQKVFEKQLNFYKKYYKVITVKELKECVKNDRLSWNSLIITFDDGYEDNFGNADKTLTKLNLPAVFFIVADKIANNNIVPYWWDRLYYYLKEVQKQENQGVNNEATTELSLILEEFKNSASDLFARMNREGTDSIERLLDRIQEKYKISNETLYRENTMLNWKQISEMGQRHDFGSHSRGHRNLLRLGDDQKYQEIVESKRIIEKFMNREVDVFSSPSGHMNEEIERLVKKGGYEFAVTAADPGINRMNNRYRLKRINIWEGSSLSLNGKFSKGYFSFRMLGF